MSMLDILIKAASFAAIIALGYLLQMQQELGLDRAEYIIEEKGLRERFKEYLREKMKISIRASDRVWGELKKRYIH